MRLSRGGLRLLVAVLLVGGSGFVGGATATVDTSIWFRVVQPDGSVVRNPVVVVSVFGPTYPNVRVLTGGPTGEVVVPLPVDDPVAAAHLANREAVNLMIRVFDKPPGSPDINAAYVTASVGVDAFGKFGELTSIMGTTIPLQPGRTAFFPGVAGTQVAGDLTEPALCEPASPNRILPCYVVDYPAWSRQTMVPIANNFGAGNDVRSGLRYHSTVVTKAGVAVQVGASGFFQADGTMMYAEENSGTFDFGTSGPNANLKAILETIYMREREGWCFSNGDPEREPICQYETTYRPYKAAGSLAQPNWWLHDSMDPTWDCWKNLYAGYEPQSTSETQSTYTLQLGGTETWATASQGVLYANSQITQQTTTGKSYIRRWDAVGDANEQYKHQYLYIEGGMIGYDPGYASSADCVAANLGRVSTQSSNVNYNVTSNVNGVPNPPPPPPETSEPSKPVCGRMPDKCD